jgi:hypothetical protein
MRNLILNEIDSMCYEIKDRRPIGGRVINACLHQP